MYLLKIAGLGFIHKSWQDAEPRFCDQSTKAKSWKTLDAALNFGNQKLTPKIAISWEVWQDSDGELRPLMRPRSVR